MTQPSRPSRVPGGVPSRIIEKLGIGCADYEFHAAFPIFFWLAAVAGTMRVTIALAQWGHREIGPRLLVGLLVVAVAVPLVARAFKSRVLVGREGVFIRLPFDEPRFVPYSDIGVVTVERRLAGAMPHGAMTLGLHEGEEIVVARRNDWRAPTSAVTALRAIADRIEACRAALAPASGVRPTNPGNSGERGERDAAGASSATLRAQRSA